MGFRNIQEKLENVVCYTVPGRELTQNCVLKRIKHHRRMFLRASWNMCFLTFCTTQGICSNLSQCTCIVCSLFFIVFAQCQPQCCLQYLEAIRKLCRFKIGNLCPPSLVVFFLSKDYLVNRLWGYPPPPLPRRHSLWTAPECVIRYLESIASFEEILQYMYIVDCTGVPHFCDFLPINA